MAPILLFITGVLAGLIVGFILSRLFSKGRSGDGSGEARLLEERLLKADQGLEQFSRQQQAQQGSGCVMQVPGVDSGHRWFSRKGSGELWSARSVLHSSTVTAHPACRGP